MLLCTNGLKLHLFIVLGVCVGLFGCARSESFVDGAKRLTKFIQEKPIGQPDSWLEKQSLMTGEWDRIVLVFGYADDYEACQELRDLLSAKYPEHRYRCLPETASN